MGGWVRPGSIWVIGTTATLRCNNLCMAAQVPQRALGLAEGFARAANQSFRTPLGPVAGRAGNGYKNGRNGTTMAIKYGRPIEATPHLTPVEVQPPAEAAARLDLTVRPRRNRKAEWARRLVRENVLTADDLIWPLFLVDGSNKRVAVDSMPGIERLSIDQAVREAERAAELAIPCLALFPYTDPQLRDEDGTEALNPGNLVCRAIRAIKKAVPDVGILCDVALDPYTSHGHDGLAA